MFRSPHHYSATRFV